MKINLIKNTSIFIKLLLMAIMLYAVASKVSFADSPNKPTDTWRLSQGGKIYDNWAVTLKVKAPNKNHSAYPDSGKKKGRSTWRCKECHGWDYKGKDGAYSKGSHFTGIKGISEMMGKPESEIKLVIRNKLHGYTKSMIPDSALDNLAMFVNRGQINMENYIDLASNKVRGDASRGANFFQTICAVCHGFDGRKINFHEGRKNPEFIGTIAAGNPWEILHKIRSGQPGADMISLRALEIKDQIDIIAYTQTLPIK